LIFVCFWSNILAVALLLLDRIYTLGIESKLYSKLKDAFWAAEKGIQAVAKEAGRALHESGSHFFNSAAVLRITPKGDGHPVLLLPGFLVSDWHMIPLQKRIEGKGYTVYLSEGGVNLGLNQKSAHHLKARLEQIYEESGHQKISIIGASLGGFIGRELAREFPHMVRGVITLGSPFSHIDEPRAVLEPLRMLYKFLNPETAHYLTEKDLVDRFTMPPPVPTTSVLSKSDVIVNWKCSLNPDVPDAENIEVNSSHVGMPWNPAAEVVVLDRLAQAEGAWKPFISEKYTPRFSPLTVITSDLPKNPHWNGQGPSFKFLFGG
jgi:pimeloyl-ACP methyl ester carboxylesterase